MLIFMSKIAFTFKGARLSDCFLRRRRTPELLLRISFTVGFGFDCQPLVTV